MTDLRKHLLAGKAIHLEVTYPGDLSAEVLSQHRNRRPLLWFGPLVAVAAVLAMVLWMRTETPSQDPALPANVSLAATDASEDALFAVNEIPSMQGDLGISPAPSGEEASFPSFSEVSAPEMPTMPSFDFSSSESAT